MSLYKKLTLGFLFLYLAGCCSKKIIHTQEARTLLFPQGTYQHDVALTIKPGDPKFEKRYNFHGVVKISKDEITVVILSAFGFTEVKIHENLKTQETNFEITKDAFKKFEPQMREYYNVLRLVLLEPESTPTHLTAQDGVTTFDFLSYDKNKIPSEVKISNPNFKVEIGVTAYDI